MIFREISKGLIPDFLTIQEKAKNTYSVYFNFELKKVIIIVMKITLQFRSI